MKKSEKINAAKKVAMAVLRNETPDKKLQKLLKEEGCVMTQDEDGFHFVDSDGKGYQFVLKGRLMVQYDRNDWLEYRALAEMLEASSSKNTAKKVEKLLDNVKAKSLRDSLAKTIEERGVSSTRTRGKKTAPKETPKKSAKKAATEKPKASKKSAKTAPKNSAKPKAEKPKKQPKPKFESEAVKEFDGKFDGVTFTQKRADACVWATGKTSAHKDALKAAGFRWSRKRQAYFRKPVAA